MQIAILGASSQIAGDLIELFALDPCIQLYLFARNSKKVLRRLAQWGGQDRFSVMGFDEFSKHQFDAVINFVGVGNPARAVAMGSEIFDITLRFDQMVLDYLQLHPACRYLFLSSGAAYGSTFDKPADSETLAQFNINRLQQHEWYGVAKLHAECRHRALADLSIIDIRIFNYFSRSQDLSSRFLITDILRAIRDNIVLKTSESYIVRDYLHPVDFHQLVSGLLASPRTNTAIDCYSKKPVDKPTLLAAMQEHFGLQYELVDSPIAFNSSGLKPFYYSLNRCAEVFGYDPVYSSLDCILEESAAILYQQELR